MIPIHILGGLKSIPHSSRTSVYTFIMEVTPPPRVKVKLDIHVMKLVRSLICWEVTDGQGSECHLTFVRGRLHIAE